MLWKYHIVLPPLHKFFLAYQLHGLFPLVKTLDPSLGYISSLSVIKSKTNFPSLFASVYFVFFFPHVKVTDFDTVDLLGFPDTVFYSFKAANYNSSMSLTKSNLLKHKH